MLRARILKILREGLFWMSESAFEETVRWSRELAKKMAENGTVFVTAIQTPSPCQFETNDERPADSLLYIDYTATIDNIGGK